MNPTPDPTILPALSAVDHYRILRSQLEHEDNLITQRLSWFLASQAFLFTGLAIAMNSPKEWRFSEREGVRFHQLVPLIAIAVGVLIWLAIVAGVIAMDRLRELAARLDFSGLPPLQGQATTRWMGLAAPLLLPPLFVVVWCVLLAVG